MALVGRKAGRRWEAIVSDFCWAQSELGDMSFDQVGQKQMRER
jgi:hypothetical protein